MRSCSKVIFYLAISALLVSCGQSITLPTITPVSIPVSTATPTSTPTQEITATATPYPYYSNVLPTINPTELPSLLESAFSVETLDTLNGHRLRRVFGWDYGYNDFEGRAEPYFTRRYQWMDSHHLLLFPKTGEMRYPNWTTEEKRAIIFNLDTGKAWLPNEQPKEGKRILDITLPRWSPEAEVLISSVIITEDDFKREGVYILTADGDFVSVYKGKLYGISPSGNKILVDDTWIDLKSKEIVDFAWYFGDRPRWRPIWSPDETRVFMCCYFYGDALTGKSFDIPNEDNIFEGKPLVGFQSLHHSSGIWLNDNYVLAKGDPFYAYMSGFEEMLPVFDISAKTYQDLRKIANLPDKTFNIDPAPAEVDVSPQKNYMWIHKPTDPTGFLVDLKTFRSWEYPRYFQWSTNGEYAVILIENSKYEIVGSKLLVLSSKKLKEMPSEIQCGKWHPTKGVCLSLTTNEQGTSTLSFLNVQDMSVQQTVLSTPLFNRAIWSPNGDYIILVTEDKALWKIDYPTLKNMEQLTRPLTGAYIESIIWSPDDEYLSFVGGTNIYIVDINKSQ